MPNTGFDGDFRQKPQQNFSGVNRNLHRDQLLRNAAQERKQREDNRKHTQFAIRIQSHIRKYIARQKWFNLFRENFDSKLAQVGDACNSDLIIYLIKRLVLFYSPSNDRNRIILFDRLLIENKDLVIECKRLNCKQWTYWLQVIFKYNSALLAPVSGNVLPSEQIQVILALNQTYLGSIVADGQFVVDCWHYVISNGHFKNLRSCVDELSRLKEYSNLNDSIYRYLLFVPLSFEKLDSQRAHHFVRTFVNEFLSGPLSDTVKNSVLPRICRCLPTHLNAGNLIDSFDLNVQQMNSYSFLWIFYSSIRIVSTNSSSLSNAQVKKLLAIIRAFSENLSLYIKTKISFSFKANVDSDEEDEYETEGHNEKGFKSFISEMFEILNDKELCATIVRYMDNIVDKDKESLISVSYLCHSMLLFHPFAIHKNRLLHSLAFNTNFLRDLWKYISTESTVSVFESAKTYLHILSFGVQHTSSVDWHKFLPSLTLFCALFNYFLHTLDDVEFFNEYISQVEPNLSMTYNYSVLPFKLTELVSMSSNLRDICISLIELAYQDRKVASMASQLFGSHQEKNDYTIQCWNLLLKASLKLLRHIYARDTRRQFCPDNHWISSKSFVQILPANYNLAIQQRGQLYQEFRGLRHLGRDEMSQFGSPIPAKDIVNVTVIQELPFVVSFHERVKVMQSIVSYEKRVNERDFYEFLSHGFALTIRRNYIYEDAFDKLSAEKIPNLKKMVRIQLISALGMEETGIDGGGVFREFLSETLKTAFDPNRGFFRLTNDGLLYPNPAIHLIHQSSNSDLHYYFIGRLLGKAIYENMLAELPLAPFFLAKLLTNNSDVEINHLASLDPVLYKNLISLKNYKGDVSELGLDFSVITCELGTNVIEELKPNGSNIPVTNSTRIEYIHLMSDFKLNKQIRNQCSAFKQGFYNVVNLDWIKMFDTRELQILLSGAPTPIDLDDLIAHTVYSGGYSKDHPVIKAFWEIVADFSEANKRKLLKFITSCSRPPLLGFKDLYPALCIQNAGNEPDRLPTSSTCMNLLKLPCVYDKGLMKEKLIYSIDSGSGFELS